jgi:GT2 family glycosyltransferase
MNCLETIYVSGTNGPFEVIVVDNQSGDNCQERLRIAYPQVKFFQMGYNAGFARANNEGIRRSMGDIVLLLNPDTLNKDHAIETCYRRLAASDYIGAGVQLLNENETPQISGNYFMTGGLNHLMVLPYTGRLIRWIGLQLKVKKTNIPEATGVVEVDWINGAFLMVKKTAIEKAGLLDEDFFLYSEEIEWCSRLNKVGKMCVYGDLRVVHLQGESANDAFVSEGKGYLNLSDKKGLQILLSGLVRIRKQFGVFWYLVHSLAHLFTIPVFAFILLLKTIFFLSNIRKEWKMWIGYTSNVLRATGYFPKIISNKPYFYKVL